MRQVYVCLEDVLERIHEGVRSAPETAIRRAGSAYGFLLEFYCGLASEKHSDRHASNHVTAAWRDYVAKYPNARRDLQPYIDALFHDGSQIKSAMLDQHQYHSTPARAAVKLARVTPEDKVLVIGGEKGVTLEVCKTLFETDKRRPRTTLVHLDTNKLRDLARGLRDLRYYSEVERYIRFADFGEALATDIMGANKVFVCQPMANPEGGTSLSQLDEQICAAWLRRQAVASGSGAIFHLKGCPERDGDTVGPWTRLRETRHGFVPYHHIRDEHARAVALSTRVIGKAKEVVMELVQFRLRGDAVKKISFDPDTMGGCVQYKMATRPRGFAGQQMSIQAGPC